MSIQPETSFLTWADETWNVRCPNCGGEYVQPLFNQMYEDKRQYSSPIGNRGPWLAVPMTCEQCPVPWAIILGMHKGQMVLSSAPLADVWRAVHKEDDRPGPVT